MKLSDELGAHEFSKAVLEGARTAVKDLYPPGTAFEIDAEPVREFTEFEFYLTACGYSLSHLLGLVDQLEHVPAYIRSGCKSKELRSAGVTRISDLVYHWENYLIRARSLEDRVLQLVSDVFHLGINNRHVNFQVVRQNAHVDASSVAVVLDGLRKLVSPLAGERNRLIHERGLLDEEFRRLEFWLIAGRVMPHHKDLATGRYLTGVRQTATRRADDVAEFIRAMRGVLTDLFEALLPRYVKVLKRFAG